MPSRFRFLFASTLCCTAALAQTAIFPPDYDTIPEGPFNSANLPLAYGTSRVQMVYDTASMTVPVGHQITSIGFRQDATITTQEAGRMLQLEIRMGYSTFASNSLTGTYDNNFVAPPTTVFGPALFTLPNLRDPNAPLPNDRFDIAIAPFTFAPASGENLLIEYRIFGTSGGGAPFNYRLDRADFVSPVANGVPGCPHITGTAVLSVNPVRPGQSYYTSLTTGPAASLCVLAINVGEPMVAPYPMTIAFGGMGPTCMGQLSPLNLATLGGQTDINGSTQWSFFIPNNIQFSGLPISSQCLLLDFFSPGGLVVSNATQVITGTNPRASVLYANSPPTTTTVGNLAYNYCPVTFFGHN